jgi:PPOX class probable F420-dependent enzyme
MNALDRFTHQRTVRLTTYRRDGTGVGTPVSLAVDGGHAYFRTWSTSWKARRLRRDPAVVVEPSTVRGVPTGPGLTGTAQLLEGAEAERAARLLAAKHPLLHGVLVPLAHKLKGFRTVHYRLTPAGADAETTQTTMGAPGSRD